MTRCNDHVLNYRAWGAVLNMMLVLDVELNDLGAALTVR